MRFLHKTEIKKMIVSSGGLQQVRLIEDTDIVIIVEKKKWNALCKRIQGLG